MNEELGEYTGWELQSKALLFWGGCGSKIGSHSESLWGFFGWATGQ